MSHFPIFSDSLLPLNRISSEEDSLVPTSLNNSQEFYTKSTISSAPVNMIELGNSPLRPPTPTLPNILQPPQSLSQETIARIDSTLSCLEHCENYLMSGQFEDFLKEEQKLPQDIQCELFYCDDKTIQGWEKVNKSNNQEDKLSFLSKNKAVLTNSLFSVIVKLEACRIEFENLVDSEPDQFKIELAFQAPRFCAALQNKGLSFAALGNLTLSNFYKKIREQPQQTAMAFETSRNRILKSWGLL